ncbi:MFS transporter [Streptomyces filipinensis]|uniref:MFS transporter n=1 Tax=Streptomyces filipinensis TaxID=66887 RepID=UPI0036E7903F
MIRTLWRLRDFRRLFSAYTITSVGDGLQPVALVFVVLEAGGSAADLGLVLAAGTIPTVALSLLGGVWADRFERRRLLAVSDLARGLCQALLAVLLLTGHATLWELVLLNVLYGVFRSVFVPSVSALVPQTVGDGDLQAANSLMGTVRNACYLAGAPLAGIIVALLDAGVVVALDGVSFFLSAACVLRMTVRSRPDSGAGRGSMLRDLRGGWQEVRSRRWLLAELLRSALELPLAVAPFFLLGPVVAQDRLGGAPAWAAISTAFLVGTLLGPVIAARYRPRRPMLVCTAIMYTGVLPPLLLGLTDWTAAIVAAELVKGCAVGFFGTVWSTLLQRHVPDEARGRVSAWDFTLTSGLTPVGYLLAAPLTAMFGTEALLVFGAAWVALGVTGQLCVRQVRTLRDGADEPATASAPETPVGEPVLVAQATEN